MICVICKQQAKWRYSPDLDIQGIGACDNHKDDVQMAYMALLTADEEMYRSMIESHKDFKKESKTPEKPKKSAKK